MSPERTEEDKLCRKPLVVVLGGEDREIKILPIRQSRAWRAEFAKVLGELPKWANVTTDNPDNFGKAMDAMLVDIPERVSDLFFKYAVDLDKDEIEEVATDEELAAAFQAVASFALPLTGSLVTAMSTLNRPTK